MARGYIQIAQFHEEAALGKQYVYLAGSTNLATVYDPVSGDPIPNPVSIGSDGYVQAFEVDDSTLFDIRVVSFNGTTMFTRQNVSVLGGTSGVPGPQGPQGLKGEKGDTGATGAAGADGADGTNGTNGTDGEDGVSLVSIRVDETSTTGKVLYNKSDDPSNWIDAGSIMPSGIGQIKIDAGDSLGYLGSKLEAGEGISIGQPNSTTTLTITNTAPETFKTQASQYSTVKDFLNAIIEGTSGVTVSTSADFNKIIISGAGIGGSGFTPRGAWNNATTYDEGDGVWYYDSSVTPVINRYYVATATNTNVNPYTDGTGWVIMFSIDQLGDQMVKLDSADSQTGFWLDKVKAGQGITFTRTVNAGGDYITIDGTPVFSVGVNGTDKTISELSNIVDLVDGEVTEVAWDGNTIKINHDTFDESGTHVFHTATGLPKFDEYGHYKGESDAIEISDVTNLEAALNNAGDGKVSIQAGDVKGYLEDKIIVAGAIVKATVGTPSNKLVQLIGTGKVAVSDAGGVGYLEDKIIAGDNVLITVEDEGTTNEKLKVSVDLHELDNDYPIIAEYGNPNQVYFASNNSSRAVIKIAGKSAELAMNAKRIDNYNKFNTSTGVFAPEKDGYYVMSLKGWVEPTRSTSTNVDVGLGVEVEVSYDGVTWYSQGGSDSCKWFYFNTTNSSYAGHGTPIAFDVVVDMRDNVHSGAHKQARIVVQQNRFGAGYDNSFYIVYPQIYFYEIKRPIGLQGPQGPKGDQGPQGPKGDKGDPGTAGEATLDGLLTFPIILSNSNISTGHTSDQGATYASSRVIAAASVEANYMSCFFTQMGTFYSLRMGIYTPGPAGDTLIAQTDVLTNTPSIGVCTLPITRDGAGNLLTDNLYLDPNTSYMPAIIIKANATNMAAYEGISTNPPNHFGRYDSWNAPAPSNLMPTTASFSQSNTFPWLAISK